MKEIGNKLAVTEEKRDKILDMKIQFPKATPILMYKFCGEKIGLSYDAVKRIMRGDYGNFGEPCKRKNNAKQSEECTIQIPIEEEKENRENISTEERLKALANEFIEILLETKGNN